MDLASIIRNKIRKDGPVSFHDFMEMALYYPGLGYYTSPGNKFGKTGDYYTSPFLGSVFGMLVGRQLEEMWRCLDKQPFTIVEYGAGTGLLTHDILQYLQSIPELYERLQYCIIEKSDVLRKQQQDLLPPQKVSWHTSIEEIAPVTGCIFSNELIDNFSVHQVVMQDELNEIFVGESFKEYLHPACAVLNDYLQQLGVVLPVGARTEINLEALAWIRQIAQALHRGFVLTIDYGFPSGELYQRTSGTLVCYHRHQMNAHTSILVHKILPPMLIFLHWIIGAG